jgi:hypothetical protein
MLYGEKFSPSEEQSGYARIIKEGYKEPNKRKNIDEYIYVHEISSMETAFYIEPSSKELIVCARGSITAEDWLVSDAFIALTPYAFKMSPRYRRYKKEVYNAMKYFPSYDIILIGHSLGGHLSTVLWNEIHNIDDDTRFIVYNRGTSPIEIFTSTPINHAQRHHYHVRGDWLSDPFERDKKTKHMIVKQKSGNKHTYRNFL